MMSIKSAAEWRAMLPAKDDDVSAKRAELLASDAFDAALATLCAPDCDEDSAAACLDVVALLCDEPVAELRYMPWKCPCRCLLTSCAAHLVPVAADADASASTSAAAASVVRALSAGLGDAVLTTMQRGVSNRVVAKAVQTLLHICRFRAGASWLLSVPGGVALVLETMQLFEDDETIQGACCGLICNALRCTAPQTCDTQPVPEKKDAQLLRAGALPLIIEALRKATRLAFVESITAALPACSALQNLAMTCCEEMRAAGCFEHLIEAMRRFESNALLQSRAALTLGLLVCCAKCDWDADTTPIITTITAALLAAMQRHADVGKVQSSACIALQFMAQRVANANAIFDAMGVADAAYAAARTFPDDVLVQMCGCALLAKLPLRHTVQERAEVAVSALRDHMDNAELATNACALLWDVIFRDRDQGVDAVMGAADIIVAAARRHAGNYLTSCAAIMLLGQVLIENVAATNAIMVDARALDVFLAALTCRYVRVRSVSLLTLWRVCMTHAGFKDLILAGAGGCPGAAHILYALARHSDDVTETNVTVAADVMARLRFAGCNLIFVLAGATLAHSARREELIRAGAVATVVDVAAALLEQTHRDKKVVRAACRTLIVLVALSGKGGAAFVAARGVDAAVAAMREYPENGVIVRCCAELLRIAAVRNGAAENGAAENGAKTQYFDAALAVLIAIIARASAVGDTVMQWHCIASLGHVLHCGEDYGRRVVDSGVLEIVLRLLAQHGAEVDIDAGIETASTNAIDGSDAGVVDGDEAQAASSDRGGLCGRGCVFVCVCMAEALALASADAHAVSDADADAVSDAVSEADTDASLNTEAADASITRVCLTFFADVGQTQAAALRAAGVIGATVAAMRRHRADSRVQRAALDVLRFCEGGDSESAGGAAIVAAGAIEPIVLAARDFSVDKYIASLSAWLLLRLVAAVGITDSSRASELAKFIDDVGGPTVGAALQRMFDFPNKLTPPQQLMDATEPGAPGEPDVICQ